MKGPAYILQTKGGGGGQGRLVQQISLPPSSAVNVATTWTKYPDFPVSSEFKNRYLPVYIIGDTVYQSGRNQIIKGNMKTRTWDNDHPIQIGFNTYAGSDHVMGMCLYDGYKLMLMPEMPPTNAQNALFDFKTLNTVDDTVSEISDVNFSTTSSAGGNSANSPYLFYDEKRHRIIAFVSTNSAGAILPYYNISAAKWDSVAQFLNIIKYGLPLTVLTTLSRQFLFTIYLTMLGLPPQYQAGQVNTSGLAYFKRI